MLRLRGDHDGYGEHVAEWTFLTNHAHVLLCVVRDPEMRLRDVADAVGITERAAQRIIADLVEAGYLERRRTGRRNSYSVHADLPLRHPMERDVAIGQLLATLDSARAVDGASLEVPS